MIVRGSFHAPAWALAAFVSFLVFGARAAGEEDPEIEGKPLSQVIKQLRSENRGLQLRAGQALSKAAPEQHAKIVPQLIPLLRSERENDRFSAAQTLGNYGPAARAAVPDLVLLLQGTQFERNRAAAARALGLILKDAQPGPEVEQVTQALSAKFNEAYDRYSDVRREAVRALGMIGPAAKACIPKLTRALTDFKIHSDEHFMVRQQAAWTCGRMGPLAAEHIDRLIAMLHTEGQHMPEVIEAIGTIGPVHDNVAPNLVDMLEKFENVQRDPTIYRALEKFGPKAALAAPLLARVLRGRLLFPDSVIAALRALQAMGPAAREALPALAAYFGIKQYSGGHPSREATAEELETMRTLSKQATEVLSGRAAQSPGPK